MGALCLLAGAFSCKKGDEDPVLSLLTRKARLTGEWEVKTYCMVQEYYSNEVLMSTYEERFEAGMSSIKATHTGWGDLTELRAIESFDFSFNKDGSWQKSIEYSYTESDDYNLGQTNNYAGYTYVSQSGVWAFEGKSKGTFKNKERLLLTVLYDSTSLVDRTYMYDYDDSSIPNESGTLEDVHHADILNATQKTEVYQILRLSNSELKLVQGDNFENYSLNEKYSYGSCVYGEYLLVKK